MKAVWVCTLFDDEKTRKACGFLNRMEAAWDDARNTCPPELEFFTEHLPFGSVVKVTFELVDPE
jgi:hypothetical protein